MKKVVTNPDGSKEEIEGTAEELAEYERKVKTETPKDKGKKRVLLNDLVTKDDLKKFMDEYQRVVQEKRVEYVPYWVPYYPQKIDPWYLSPQYPWPYSYTVCGTTLTVDGTVENNSTAEVRVLGTYC